ncbi:polyphosphate--AMP phosphotransferase [Adlercreutzia aquisgranensis]|nr:polyphosphate--AMP phosphotransferase [Adlercreutzia aquisgranensis]
MLETVDLSAKDMDKGEYKTVRRELTDRLVVLQQQARSRGIGLVVLFEGWNGAGKGSRISDLMYNLDARATSVHVTEDADAESLSRFAGLRYGVDGMHSVMEQFWRALGERGTITFYDRGWYTAAVQQMLFEESREASAAFGEEAPKDEAEPVRRAVEASRGERRIDTLRRSLAAAADFERQLTDDGYVVVKFFVHISQEAQRRRLRKLHDDPATRWRAPKSRLRQVDEYAETYRLFDNLLEGSDFSYAPWHLVAGEDKRRANVQVAQTLVDALERALAAGQDEATAEAAARAEANSAAAGEAAPEDAPRQQGTREAAEAQARAQAVRAPSASRFKIVEGHPTVDGIVHTSSADPMDEAEYREQLKRQQKRLGKLEMEMYRARIPLILMYEGWDAAGKGGNIKRVAQALDARAYTIFPSPAPTKPELMHPFLWRYWTRLPKAGHVGIYDRSWYGRVLVERVEGFASPAEWARAYDEINEFEQELVRWGAILLKFWVDVSPDEQLARFKARAADPAKQWKITDEDWRNRDKYPQYKAAVDDMFRLTSTPFAPWIVLESDDKRHARVKALKIINDALEARLRD